MVFGCFRVCRVKDTHMTIVSSLPPSLPPSFSSYQSFLLGGGLTNCFIFRIYLFSSRASQCHVRFRQTIIIKKKGGESNRLCLLYFLQKERESPPVCVWCVWARSVGGCVEAF